MVTRRPWPPAATSWSSMKSRFSARSPPVASATQKLPARARKTRTAGELSLFISFETRTVSYHVASRGEAPSLSPSEGHRPRRIGKQLRDFAAELLDRVVAGGQRVEERQGAVEALAHRLQVADLAVLPDNGLEQASRLADQPLGIGQALRVRGVAGLARRRGRLGSPGRGRRILAGRHGRGRGVPGGG